MLCCAVPRCAALCCAVLCCVVLCCFGRIRTVHHIAVDLWSFVVLLDDLSALYCELTKQRVPYPLSPTPMQYVQCLPSQDAAVTGLSGERLWHFWQTQLVEPLPVLQLPTDRYVADGARSAASHLLVCVVPVSLATRATVRARRSRPSKALRFCLTSRRRCSLSCARWLGPKA